MTRNQILYQEHVERARANRAQEGLTAHRDAETKRSNLANEAETNRANIARETETNRSNLAREFETNRSNVARETETHRSNVARETEAARSNLANEVARAKELGETTRSNMAKEQETNRSNVAKEGQAVRELGETIRTHKANESLRAQEGAETARSNLAREIENLRHNVAVENETVRSNLSGEENTRRGQDVQQAIATAGNLNRIEVANLNNATNQAIAELRERGLNDRQAKQFAADAVKVVHDDIAGILSNADAIREIRRTIVDMAWTMSGGGK